MKTGFGTILGMVCLLAGCSAAPGEGHDGEEASAIQLNLSTIAASGTEYRLGPATFDIFDAYNSDPTPIISLISDGAETTLHTPLDPGYYGVKLQPGWTLSRVDEETLTPVAATLLSNVEQLVHVLQFETSPVTYAFHLGEAGIDIGVTVDEGMPPGYDARLVPQPGTSEYILEWRGGGSVCCFSSLADAQANYGNANIYLAPN